MHPSSCDLDKVGRFPHWPAEPGEARMRGAYFLLFVCAYGLALAGMSAAF
jgi:hypothetical protein